MHTWLPAFAKAIGEPEPARASNSAATAVGGGSFAIAGGLRTVHRAFVVNVPYEDLAVQLGESEPLDTPALVRRILSGGRGGYCFEANTGEPTNHMALVVRTPDAGQFIAEARLGEGPLDPLPLTAGPVEAGAFHFMIDRDGEGWWVGQHAYGSIPGFWFSDTPASLADFQPHHMRLSTSASSNFVKTLVVQSPFSDHIVTLRACTLSVNGPERRERHVLDSAATFAAALRDRWGIDPAALGPDRLAQLWARVTRRHQTRYVSTS